MRMDAVFVEPEPCAWMASRLLTVEPCIPRGMPWISAFVGTLSHLGLDSIMHAEVKALLSYIFWELHSGCHIPRGAPRLVRCSGGSSVEHRVTCSALSGASARATVNACAGRSIVFPEALLRFLA